MRTTLCLIVMFVVSIGVFGSRKAWLLKETSDQEYNKVLWGTDRKVVMEANESKNGLTLTGTCNRCSIKVGELSFVCTKMACFGGIPSEGFIGKFFRNQEDSHNIKLLLSSNNNEEIVSINDGNTWMRFVSIDGEKKN